MKDIQINTNVPEMLGTREIAQRFGISEHYARRLALSGEVKAVRVGRGKILINARSVADYFNSSYITDGEPAPINGLTPIPVKL